MRLLSIQVGLPRELEWEGNRVLTGIFKDEVKGSVRVGRLNLDGDGQADLRVHGGVDKAVYAYSKDFYPWWKQQLPQNDFSHGSLGENLTVDTLDEQAICVGDVIGIGETRLQVAQPRLPCFKLGIRLGTQQALKIFMIGERPGVYFRVLQEGFIRAGDPLEVLEKDPERVSVVELFRFMSYGKAEPEWARRALRVKSMIPKLRGKIADALEASTQ